MADHNPEPSTARRPGTECDDLRPNPVSTPLATAPLTIFVTADHRQARMEHDGRPIGTVFTSIAQGSYYLDAQTVVHWFLYGAALHALNPVEMTATEFASVKLATYKLLGEAARSAARCQLTAPKYAAFFMEAALRGQLPNYERALASLAANYRYGITEAASRLNPRLTEWCWVIEAAQTEVQQAGLRPRNQKPKPGGAGAGADAPL
jgi:hypothetical protein